MRKLFASNKKAKRKPGDYKVPVPMVGGILNAKLTEAQIDAILTGRNNNSNNNKNHLSADEQQRKPSSSVSTETRSQNKKRQDNNEHIPARPISSPPILVMPKPRRPLRQADSVLRSHEFDKTQIESSSGESEQHEDEDGYMDEFEQEQDDQDNIEIHRVMVLWPENWTDLAVAAANPTMITTTMSTTSGTITGTETVIPPAVASSSVPLLSNKLQRQQLLAAPEDGPQLQEFEQILTKEKDKITNKTSPPIAEAIKEPTSTTITAVAAATSILPSNNEVEQQRVLTVTSSSEDSNLQYDSARQSPLASVSSDQTPDHTSMDILKRQLSQVSEKKAASVSNAIVSDALLIVDDEDDDDDANINNNQLKSNITTAPITTSFTPNNNNNNNNNFNIQPQFQQPHIIPQPQPSSDTSTPKLAQKSKTDIVVVPSNKNMNNNGIAFRGSSGGEATESSTGTSSNTVSPLLHAKITSTGMFAVPEPASAVTPAAQSLPFQKRSGQCDEDITNNRQSEHMSQEQHQQFNMSLEALRRQVDFLQQQQQLERRQWEKRELEHREREKHMMNKINETQIQLQQALYTMSATVAASTTNNNHDPHYNQNHTSVSMSMAPITATMQELAPPQQQQQQQQQQHRHTPRSLKGKETRDENGALYPEQPAQQDASSSTNTPSVPSWDSRRQQQQLRPVLRNRSRSSEAARSTVLDKLDNNNESWKRNGTSGAGDVDLMIQQQQRHPQQQGGSSSNGNGNGNGKERLSYGSIYGDDSINRKGVQQRQQKYISRKSQGEYNNIVLESNQQQQPKNSQGRKHQQRQLRIHNADSFSDESISSDEDEPRHFGFYRSSRHSQTGSASSMPIYSKNHSSVENSPHGSNVSAKSDGSLGRNSRRSNRRQRSRSHSAPESPQDYHSAVEEEDNDPEEEEYLDYESSHNYRHRRQQQHSNDNSPRQHQQRQNRWSRSQSSSARNNNRLSNPTMMYDLAPPSQAPQLPRHYHLAAAFHPSNSRRSRSSSTSRRRDSQRMMDHLDEDIYLFGGIPPPTHPPPHVARLPRSMHHHHHHHHRPPPPPPPPPGSGMVGAPYADDWPIPPTNGWPPGPPSSSLYRIPPGPPSFSSAAENYQEPVNLIDGPLPGQPGLLRQYSNRGPANGNGGGGSNGHPPSQQQQQQTFPPSIRHQGRMIPAAAMYQAMEGPPPSMGFR